MDTKKELTIVLWVVVLVGIFFMAKGITGNVIGNSASDFCTGDRDCSNGKVCCISVNETGMCSDSNFLCDRVTNSTVIENPQNKSFNFDIILGFLIMICVLVAFYANERKKKSGRVKGKRVIRKVVRKRKR